MVGLLLAYALVDQVLQRDGIGRDRGLERRQWRVRDPAQGC